MRKNIIFLLILAVFGGIIGFCTCTNNEPVGLEVDGVYYNDVSADVYYWGESVHDYQRIYLIGVSLRGNFSPDQFKKVDWKSVCKAEDNDIVFFQNGGTLGGINSHEVNFILRIKNPYDLTSDINKRIFYNDKYFTVTSYTGGEFGHTDESTCYISTRSEVIDFSYFHK